MTIEDLNDVLIRNDTRGISPTLARLGFSRPQIYPAAARQLDIASNDRSTGLNDIFGIFRKTLWQSRHRNTSLPVVFQPRQAAACSEYVETAIIHFIHNRDVRRSRASRQDTEAQSPGILDLTGQSLSMRTLLPVVASEHTLVVLIRS